MDSDGSVVISVDMDTKKADKALKSFTESVANLGKILASVVSDAVSGLLNNVADLASYGDHIDKMSQKLGISAEAYQEWDAVMQHSGTSVEMLQASMRQLAVAAQTDKKALQQLGITQDQVANMSQEELFSATIEALQNLEDEQERTYLASQLLGRGSTELGALLNMSAEETQAMKDRVHELGGVMSDEAVKASAKYQDSLQDMQTAMAGMKRGLIADFLPGITTVMDGLTEIFAGNPGDGLEKIKTGINSVVETISAALPEVIKLGSEIIVTLATAIIDNLPSLITAAGEAILAIATGIVEHLPEIIKTGLDVILSLALGIANSLPELIPTIVDIVLQIVDTLTDPDTLGALVDASIAIIIALALGLIDALPKLLEKAPEIIQNLVTALVENVPKLFEAALKIITELVKGIKDNFYRLTKAAWEIVQTILDGIGDIFSKMIDIGSDIVEGIWQGISNGYTWITGKIQGWVGDVVGFFKRILGIASPSKVFASMGEYMMEGMAVGLDDGTKYAVDAAENAVESVRNAATFSLPAMSVPMPSIARGGVVPASRQFLASSGTDSGVTGAGSVEAITAAVQRAIMSFGDKIVVENRIFLDSREIKAGQNRLARVTGG